MSGAIEFNNKFTLKNLVILDNRVQLANIPDNSKVNLALPNEVKVFAYGSNFICRELGLPAKYLQNAIEGISEIYIRFFPGSAFNKLANLAEIKYQNQHLQSDKEVFAYYNIETRGDYKFAVIDVAINSRENSESLAENISIPIETLRELLCSIEHELAHSQGCDEYLARRRELEIARASGAIKELESKLETIRSVQILYNDINISVSLDEFEKDATPEEVSAFYDYSSDFGEFNIPEFDDSEFT